MTGYRWFAGRPVEVAIVWPGRELSPFGSKGHVKTCLLMVGPDRSHPAYCVLTDRGAFDCPYSDVQGPRRTTSNASLSKTGVLTLDIPLGTTHAAPPLAWQRYPHVDGYIHPWTSSGHLRPGLQLRPSTMGPGGCYSRSEDIPDKSAITCVLSNQGRTGPCYAQKLNWHAGDIAACGGAADLTFYRLRITGGSWSSS